MLHLRRAVVVEPSQRNLPQVLYQHGAHVNAKIGIGVMTAAGGHAEQHPSRRRARDGDQNPHRQHVGRGNAFRDGQLGNARDCEIGDELARRRQGRDGDVAYDPPFHRLDQTQIRAPRGGTVDRFHKRHSFLSRKQGRRRGKPADVQIIASRPAPDVRAAYARQGKRGNSWLDRFYSKTNARSCSRKRPASS